MRPERCGGAASGDPSELCTRVSTASGRNHRAGYDPDAQIADVGPGDATLTTCGDFVVATAKLEIDP